MIYQELKQGALPCLSFMKNTDYVMYVGPELSPMELSLLHSINVDAPVIYLPEIVQGISKEMFEYNFPGVAWPGEISAEMIYSQIRAELGEHLITPESRLLVRFEDDVLVVFDAKESLSLAVSYLLNKCKVKRRLPDLDFFADEWFSYGGVDEVESIHCCMISQEALFDEEMEQAAEDVKIAIKHLLLNGFSASIIRSWLEEEIKLSRIRITKQYAIMLVDYGKEVKMSPLPKTVFLFYLRHPEGVMFSHLMDHRDELLDIYSHVCRNDDVKKMHSSIARLTDPLDNSISEKCAAIKKAFMMKIEDSIASNYYVTGVQGGKKCISLDRRLVEWECEL